MPYIQITYVYIYIIYIHTYIYYILIQEAARAAEAAKSIYKKATVGQHWPIWLSLSLSFSLFFRFPLSSFFISVCHVFLWGHRKTILAFRWNAFKRYAQNLLEGIRSHSQYLFYIISYSISLFTSLYYYLFNVFTVYYFSAGSCICLQAQDILGQAASASQSNRIHLETKCSGSMWKFLLHQKECVVTLSLWVTKLSVEAMCWQ